MPDPTTDPNDPVPTSELPEVHDVSSQVAAMGEAQGVNKATPTRAEFFEGIITRWFNEHMNNSPVSRSGEVYAHVKERLTNLRDMLVKEV